MNLQNLQTIECVIDSIFGFRVYHIVTDVDRLYVITTKTIRSVKTIQNSTLSKVMFSLYRIVE